MLPGNPIAGTGNVTPDKNVLPDKPVEGTVVIHSFLFGSNTVLAEVVFEEKVIRASGTETLYEFPAAVN
jgi:hypothetical protein